MSNEEAFNNVFDEINWGNFPSVIKELASINPENIDNELVNHPKMYGYYYGIMVAAKKKLELAQVERDSINASVRQAELDRKLKADEKCTDKYLEFYVLGNQEVKEKNKEVIEAEFRYNLFKALISSLEHKKDCIIQISSTKRAEIKLMS